MAINIATWIVQTETDTYEVAGKLLTDGDWIVILNPDDNAVLLSLHCSGDVAVWAKGGPVTVAPG